jgi:carbon storage regulator
MLVLSRKVGERIHIGHDIVVTILSVRGGRVRLGIEAPEGIQIKRHELLFEDERAETPESASSAI